MKNVLNKIYLQVDYILHMCSILCEEFVYFLNIDFLYIQMDFI